MPFGTGLTSDGRGKALGVNNGGTPVNNGANALWVDVSFSEDSCTGNFQFDSSTCQTQLETILNGCNTGGLYPKTGGWIEENCAVYRLIATESEDF